MAHQLPSVTSVRISARRPRSKSECLADLYKERHYQNTSLIPLLSTFYPQRPVESSSHNVCQPPSASECHHRFIRESRPGAVYLPPSDLALKYNKGLQCSLAVQPHPSAGQAGSTKIKKIETFYVRPRWLFVRIETEGGVVGWGEGTLEGHTEAVQGSMKDIARR